MWNGKAPPQNGSDLLESAGGSDHFLQLTVKKGHYVLHDRTVAYCALIDNLLQPTNLAAFLFARRYFCRIMHSLSCEAGCN